MKKCYFEVDAECKSCGGTGIYKGMAERDCFGVVCSTCKGTGCQTIKVKYRRFTGRKIRSDVKVVLQKNPGICVCLDGRDGQLPRNSFGGMLYGDWLKNQTFPAGSEMRDFTCPKWWHQSVEIYDKFQCYGVPGCRFSDCIHFANKSKCWARFDELQLVT